MTATRTSVLLAGAVLAAAALGGCKNRSAESPATPPANTSGTGTTPDTGGTGSAMPPAATPTTPAVPPPSSGGETTTKPPSGTSGSSGTGTTGSGTVPDRDDSRNNATRDRKPTY
jgi:hypothetical protein